MTRIEVAALAQAVDKDMAWSQDKAGVHVHGVTLEDMTIIIDAARWALRKWHWWNT